MKQRYALFAGLVAIGLACAQPAAAQFIPYPAAGDMPPHEVIALVSSAGLKPVGRPVRRGPAYVLQAINQSGREVRVIVDARLRRIARVVAVAPGRAAEADVPPPPAPYGRPPGDITGALPEGRGPSARVSALPPDTDMAEPYGPTGQQPYGQVAAVGATPVVPSRPAVAEPTTREAGPPPLPLPRPRPKFAAAEPVTTVPGATATPAETVAPAQPKSIGAPAAAELAARLAVHEPVYEEQE